MASKSGPGKKSGSTRSGDAGDKDRIIGELKERVAVLENELWLKQSNTTPQEVIDREPMGEYLALFQRMVDKAADMVFLLGPMGRILYVNDAACKVLGYTREELLSMTVFDINQKHQVDNWHEHEDELKKQGSMTFENVLKTKDNRLIPVENSANYARLGDKEYNYSFIRDITERKQIEEELRSSRDELEQRVQERTRELSKSEAMLRQIIDTSPIPMVVYREEKIYHINKKFVEAFGYTMADIPSIDEWWPLAYPDKAYCEFVKNRWYVAVGDAVKNKTSIAPQEATVTCKDGSKKDVLGFFSSIGDMNLAILQDITERKNAEEALQESEARYRELVENANSIILQADRKGKITFINEYGLRFFGYAESEIIGKNALGTIIPSTDSAGKDLGSMLDDLLKNPEEYRMNVHENMRKNGEHVWVSWTNRAVYDDKGDVVGLFSIGNDITRLKQAEETLRENEARFRSYFEMPLLGILITSLEKGITSANDKMCELVGYSEDELKSTTWDKITHPEDLANDVEQFNRVLAGEIDSYTMEKRFIHKNGTIIPTILSVGCVRHPDRTVNYLIAVVQDISERKRAEEAMRMADVRFRSLIQNSTDIIRILDKDRRIIYDSPSSDKILGYPPGHTLGKSPLEFIHPDDRERVRNDLDGVYGGRSPGTPTEFRIRKADGSYLDVESTGKNMIGIPGVDGIVITTRPITKRKQAEKALVRDRYILMKSQEVAHLGNWAWNLETGEFTASAENYRIYGYESGGVKPTREWVLSRVHCEDRVAVADFMEARARDGKRGSTDFRVIRPDGSVVYVNTIVDKAVRDKTGKVTRLYGITQDITERKRAEQAVVAERQRLFSLLDELPGFVYLQDTDYRIHYANRRFKELFGDPKNVHCYEIFYGREEPCEVCSTRRALDTNTPFEWEWTSPAGRTYHLYDYPFREKDGPPMVLELGIDITGRKQAEEELKTAKQQAELYLDLMGHDINNMHQVALGYLELARDVTPGEGQAMFLDKPVEVLQRSAQLISNVRKLQKLHEGVFQTQDVDVSRVLKDVQREFGAIPNKRVMLNLNGHGPCLVRANELLHDVFANLLSNAIKHTGDQTNITVGLDIVKDNGALFCRVAVEDDGPGIPDGLKANIFNRMLKGTNKAKGMGLGLYLVKSLVDSYGGRVWVEDRVRCDHTKGARFVVLLPAIEK